MTDVGSRKMVFGIITGVVTSGTTLRTIGAIVQVRWAIGITSWVPLSELTTVNPRSAGGDFPV